jgi:hypothetical protein
VFIPKSVKYQSKITFIIITSPKIRHCLFTNKDLKFLIKNKKKPYMISYSVKHEPVPQSHTL